jgi:acetylornithine deacetylase/succinyl-diaminopimelate desuccinylase-like protein
LASTDLSSPECSIYLTFVPDEEVGGSGMAAVLESELYKNQLPGIALALDEGLASTNSVFSVFYGERLPWWVDVTAKQVSKWAIPMPTIASHLLFDLFKPQTVTVCV